MKFDASCPSLSREKKEEMRQRDPRFREDFEWPNGLAGYVIRDLVRGAPRPRGASVIFSSKRMFWRMLQPWPKVSENSQEDRVEILQKCLKPLSKTAADLPRPFTEWAPDELPDQAMTRMGQRNRAAVLVCESLLAEDGLASAKPRLDARVRALRLAQKLRDNFRYPFVVKDDDAGGGTSDWPSAALRWTGTKTDEDKKQRLGGYVRRLVEVLATRDRADHHPTETPYRIFTGSTPGRQADICPSSSFCVLI